MGEGIGAALWEGAFREELSHRYVLTTFGLAVVISQPGELRTGPGTGPSVQVSEQFTLFLGSGLAPTPSSGLRPGSHTQLWA